jgi:hypothetical protein
LLASYEGTLRYSEDEGESWHESPSSPKGNIIFGVAWTRPHTAIAVGDHGQAWQTQDDGHSWQTLTLHPDLTDQTLSGITFLKNGTGFIVGYEGVLLKSQDAGLTWLKVPMPTDEALYGLAFRDDNVGLILGGGGRIFTTRDGGNSWWQGSTGDPDDDIFSAAWLGGDTVMVSGAWGHQSVTRLSVDAGKSWREIHPPTDHLVINIHRIDRGRVAFMGSEGMVLILDLPNRNSPTDKPSMPFKQNANFSVQRMGITRRVQAEFALPFAGEMLLTLHSLDGRHSQSVFQGPLAQGHQSLSLSIPNSRGPTFFQMELKGQKNEIYRHTWIQP